MSKKPCIGIPIPTSSDLEYNRQCWPDYAEAVIASGGEPLQISLHLSRPEMQKIASECDGFVLPGSPADVNPERYGQEPIGACAPPDPLREEVDLFLLEHAYLHRKPLLCICFGMQILNVWRGGTLLQDLSYMPVNHSAGRSVAVAHPASVIADSCLGSLLEKSGFPVDSSSPISESGFPRLPINSSHHQAVAIPGVGLRIVARCPLDGVIEALEGDVPPHFVIAVQWHPERGFHEDVVSQHLFQRFIEESSSAASAVGEPMASAL